MTGSGPDYNKTLLKISASLANARNTFGSESPQYQAVLGLLRECLREIEGKRHALDPETLSLAMEFMDLGGR